jgi:formamidopyrimidine-DNA glycosylase
MPELPEVETVLQGLEPELKGLVISKVWVLNPKLREKVPDDFSLLLEGQRIEKLWRRSKYLVIDLQTDLSIIIHLGMSGRLNISGSFDIKNKQKHDHIIIEFNNGRSIIFSDPRRFGLVSIANKRSINSSKYFRALGPEPLSDEFNSAYLSGKIFNKKKPIKTLLMDAEIVVGVGNIYASESLFKAKILPTRLASSLTENEVNLLILAIKQVLQEAIASGGSSLRDYVKADGNLGYFQFLHKVYAREASACYECGYMIRKVKQSGRSSFYCKNCQT